MIDAIAAFEESFDVEWASPPAPHFLAEKQGFRAFIDTRKLENIDWMRLNPTKLANSVTLLADADDPESLSRLVRAARDLRRDNPYALYQIVLTSDTRIPSGVSWNASRTPLFSPTITMSYRISSRPTRRKGTRPACSSRPGILP